MLVRAALVPDTVLLVPGAAGAADPVPDHARAARAAVTALVEAAPDTIVVVATGPRRTVDDDRWGPVRPTLAAAGVPDHAWASDVVVGAPGRPGPGRGPDHAGAGAGDAPTLVRDTAAATGLALLAEAGYAGPVRVLQLRPDEDAARRRALGAALVAQGRVALLVLGSLSARRGPDAPLPQVEDAASFDDGVLADLGRWDGPARERLAAVPATQVSRLAVSAWTGWQVLLGAAEGTLLEPRVLASGAPLGATYVVVRWAEPA